MDKHLNCFYSYNLNEELIENNLTRSFIVTLLGLTSTTRNLFFHALDDDRLCRYDFSHAQFALQNNIDIDPKKHYDKHNIYIMTLSSDTFIQSKDELLGINKEHIRSTLKNKKPSLGSHKLLIELCSGSIPDAWIYDAKENKYCFLIECKKQDDFLYFPQLVRHAYINYGLDDIEDIRNCIIKITWTNILENFLNIIENKELANDQEKFLIDNFVHYLGFFGYSYFKGFDFHSLPDQPNISFKIKDITTLFYFNSLNNPVDISLKFPFTDSTDSLILRPLFDFHLLAE